MNKNIIDESKKFIGTLRECMNKVGDDNLFIVSIKGDGNSVSCVSISTYTDMKVGSVAREGQPMVYKAADKLYSFVKKNYKGVSGVSILLTDEHETSVFQDGRLLRVCNLDA